MACEFCGMTCGEHLTRCPNFTQQQSKYHCEICGFGILDGEEYLFEGKVNGTIINERKGQNGFGYDPIFVPEGFDKTFAELSAHEKNSISHRARAVANLIQFLKNTEVK